MKNKIIFLLTTCLFLLFTACDDFLTEDSESKISNELISENPKIANAYILGMYRDWRECHRKWANYAIGTDEFKLGGVQYRDDADKRGIELYSGEFSSTNSHTLEYWKSRYQIIANATLLIDNLKKYEGTEDNDEMLQYYSEACALRGACYFELVQYFGEIPLNNTEVIAEYGSKRQPLSLVYEKIVEDLNNAVKYLPEHSSDFFTDEANRRRFSKAFAHAMLGKTYLYALEESGFRNYEKAAEHFETVFYDPAFGQTGASEYGVIFDETGASDNTGDYEREMVYAFRFKPVRDDNNEFQWNFGSRAVAVMTPVEATAYFAGFDHIMPTAYCYSMKADGGLWEEGDYRKNLSIRYDFKYNGKQPELIGYCYGDELDPHIKKYEDKRIEDEGLNTWHSGKNVPYIRFADIVLCYAECLFYTGQKAAGIKLINEKIRRRAFNTPRPTGPNMWPEAMGDDEFKENLLDERMRELCFEGWRRMDLIRTGKVQQYVPARNTWFLENGVTSINETRLRFPVPLDELNMNSDMSPDDQNTGF